MKKYKQENEQLRRMVVDLQWMARRYADGRKTYAPSMVNDITLQALRMGIPIKKANEDEEIWAYDGMFGYGNQPHEALREGLISELPKPRQEEGENEQV
jgi:hypothetical protein